MNSIDENILNTKEVMNLYIECLKNSWLEVDSKELQFILNDIRKVLDGEFNVEQFCENNDIDHINRCWVD